MTETMERTPTSRRPAMEAIAQLWWLPLLRGVLLVILGAYALFQPGMSMVVFAQIAGFFLVFDGILAILAGITGQVPSRGWTIARGILAVLVGIFVFANPLVVAGVTAIMLVCLIGGAAIASGALEIAAAVRDRKEIEGEGWLILGGAVLILFGILLLLSPLAFGLTMVRVLGAFAILGGISMAVFAFRLRRLGKRLRTSEG